MLGVTFKTGWSLKNIFVFFARRSMMLALVRPALVLRARFLTFVLIASSEASRLVSVLTPASAFRVKFVVLDLVGVAAFALKMVRIVFQSHVFLDVRGRVGLKSN